MHADVAVVGGGIAGASAAAFLAPRASVVLLEAEPTLGYHTTGRSAALYTECYGEEPIRRLSLASRGYFVDRDEPLATTRGVMFASPPGDRTALDDFYRNFSALVPDLELLSPGDVSKLVPIFAEGDTAGAVLEPRAMDLDVHAILMSYVATARIHGASILAGHAVTSIERSGSVWSVTGGDIQLTADIVINATGAWGDDIATLAGVQPLSLSPLKRSAFTFDPGMSTHDWPMVVDMGEEWYIKPEGPFLLGSAASEIPEEPNDARPDELDVALGIMRINEATGLSVRSVKNQWAGLRTFTPDRVPAVGFDADVPGFLWLVGQGGYGIHTSPAMGILTAGLVLDGAVPDELAAHGITPEMFDPSRFR